MSKWSQKGRVRGGIWRPGNNIGSQTGQDKTKTTAEDRYMAVVTSFGQNVVKGQVSIRDLGGRAV